MAIRRILVLGLAALALAASPCGADNYRNAEEAYDRGDLETARKEWTVAAEQGDVDAQYNLGCMLLNGQGGPRDPANALSWLLLAAKRGNPAAQYNVGLIYYNGVGVRSNYPLALRWYARAADAGDVDAQINLAAMYANGEAVARDPVRAHYYWSMAAARGSERAQANLDKLEGLMTPEELARAREIARIWRERHPQGQ